MIQSKLKLGKYKMTPQRQVVLDVMKESQDEHLTAEEVLLVARKKSPGISMATVYRTLERLSTLEILYKIQFDEGRYRYELADKAEHQHHHIQCVDCNRIFELEEDLLKSVEQKIKKKGFSVIDHQLTVYALCPDCNKE